MPTKSEILQEIRRTAEENGGKPLGVARFSKETGIPPSAWIGKYWARWSDAVVEAELTPNSLQGLSDEGDLLRNLATLTRELGHFPVKYDIVLKARTFPGFPWPDTFFRLGNKRERATRLREFSLANGYKDVAVICEAIIAKGNDRIAKTEDDVVSGAEQDLGFVYLLKSGRYYKVGRSNAVGRRERELAIQLPEKAEVLHYIRTDDPVGIESY